MKRFVASFLVVLLCCVSIAALADDGWTCQNCGNYNPSNANFCGICATAKRDTGYGKNIEYNAWVCPTCGGIFSNNLNFCTNDATSRTAHEQDALLIETNNHSNAFYASQATMDVYDVWISSKEGQTIPIYTEVSGRYVIWLTDSVDGYRAIAYYEDKYGNEVGEWPTKHSESLSSTNGGVFTKDLDAGQYYNLVLMPDYGFDKFKAGGFTLNLYRPSQIQDISGYDLIYDSFVCKKQENRYSFTPEVTGLYAFTCTEAYNGVELNITVLDRLNNKVSPTGYGSSIRMNESLQYELIAGQTYNLSVEPNSKSIGKYTLQIGYQQETIDITGCEIIGDRLYFPDQSNAYTYTAAVTGTYEFTTSVMNRRANCYLRVYDEYGYVVFGNNSWDRNCELKGGRLYTIEITNDSKSDVGFVCDYIMSIIQK